MAKPNLPPVTEDTIKEIGNEALKDKDALFKKMAVSNPILYRLIYDMYNRPDTNKETMLGMVIATYHILDRQIEKGKRSRKRLRHNENRATN